jgi:hypothetical protein
MGWVVFFPHPPLYGKRWHIDAPELIFALAVNIHIDGSQAAAALSFNTIFCIPI